MTREAARKCAGVCMIKDFTAIPALDLGEDTTGKDVSQCVDELVAYVKRQFTQSRY